MSRLRRWVEGGSGPEVGALFVRLLGLVQLVAAASLLSQVGLLIGERGLLPLAPLVARLGGVSFWEFPTVHRWGAGDGALAGWLVAAMAAGSLGALRVWPRLMSAAVLVIYVSYTTSCRVFTGFQWDLMLIEATALSLLLPDDRRAPVAHFLFRVLLFKLYFESGVAKWQSHLRDWHDGSAMTHYYQTAPIPGLLGWWFHHLPAWFHRAESWAVLALELALPFAVFGPRAARLAAFAGFTGFQVVNLVTANYGFFCYLSLALHVFLLDDGDVARARGALERLAPLRRLFSITDAIAGAARRPSLPAAPPWLARASGVALGLVALAYVALSAADGLSHFKAADPGLLADARKALRPLHLVNTYHLFGHITRERVEPQFEALEAGQWRPLHLRHKPGDVREAPHIVAPHQPRVDFQLWFHGLSARRGLPPYAAAILDRLCTDPPAVQPLFGGALPRRPRAVRVSYLSYRFTTPEERASTGAFWAASPLFATAPVECPGSDR